MHSGPLAHGQEMRQHCPFQEDVDGNLPSVTGIEQIPKDVDISESVHHDRYNLQGRAASNFQED